ncbi:MAG: archaemetzincin family Zn-dependent metalloprotease [candidate division WOR-3 bacterium]
MLCLYQQVGLEFSELIEEILSKKFNLPVIVGEKFQIPENTFNPLRAQYDATNLIEALAGSLNKECSYHLFIVEVDIYTPRFNFILGLANTQKHIALVSIHRLSRGGLLKNRLIKEVIHELGHLWGLDHCTRSHCVMYFSNTVADTDHKGSDFCEACRRKLERI